MKLLRAKNSAATMRVIELGSSRVVAGEFLRLKSGGLKLIQFETESFLPEPQNDATIGSGIIEAVKKVLGAFADRGAQWILVIPGHWTLAKVVKIPALASTQRAKIILFEAQQNIPFPLEEVVWNHHVLSDTETESEVMFAAAKRENVDALVALLGPKISRLGAIRSAGLSSRVVLAADRDLRSESALMVVVGARSTHLLFRDGSKFLIRSLSMGGNSISRSIADKLKMAFAEAEQLKLRVWQDGISLPEASPAAVAVTDADALFRGKLLLEIKRSIVTFRRQQEGADPATVWLAGGGARGPKLSDWLTDKVEKPVRLMDPFQGVLIAAEIGAKITQFGRERLTDFVGAALANESDLADINLLPRALIDARSARSQRPRWILVAVLAVVAVALPGVHFSRLADGRDHAAKELSRRLGPVHVLQDQNRANLERLDTVEAEIEILRQLGVAQTAWGGFLADLQRQLRAVQDVWLERLLILPNEEAKAPRSGTEFADEGGPDISLATPLRLRLSGRLLDRENPLSRVSQSSYERVTSLLNGMVESDFIIAVEGERFDASESGILRFDFTLVINPGKLL